MQHKVVTFSFYSWFTDDIAYGFSKYCTILTQNMVPQTDQLESEYNGDGSEISNIKLDLCSVFTYLCFYINHLGGSYFDLGKYYGCYMINT